MKINMVDEFESFKKDVLDILKENYGNDTRVMQIINGKVTSKIAELHYEYQNHLIKEIHAELHKINNPEIA